VHATVPKASQVDFPAWEGTQRSGYDGVVATTEGNAFVPAGTSIWEIGTSNEIQDKANEDFHKRTALETTYIFVTPRKWTGKITWRNEKNGLGHWKQVRAYDSDDLEQWLETVPAVSVWFGRMLGQRPPGADDVERYWESVSALTEPSLQSDVFVASRGDQEKKVIEWLEGPPSVLAIECRAPTEVVDFVALTR
jgi:hypothetical protein